MSSSIIFSQEDNKELLINLLSEATKLETEGDHIGGVEKLLEALEVDSSLSYVKKTLIRKMLVDSIHIFKDRTDLVVKSYKYIKDQILSSHYTITLLQYYYTNGYEQQAETVLMKLANRDPKEFKVLPVSLEQIDFNRNPDLAKKIYKILMPFLYGPPIEILPYAYIINDEEAVRDISQFYLNQNPQDVFSDSLLIERINYNFSRINPQLNLILFKEVSQTFQPFIQDKCTIDLLVKWYMIKDNKSFDIVFNELSSNARVYDDEDVLILMLQIDSDGDPERFTKLMRLLASNVNDTNFKTISDIPSLYLLAKNYYAAGLESQTKILFNLIYNQISAEVQTFDNYIRWGMSCISNNEFDKAKKFFNNVITFGKKADRDKLKSELTWWASKNFYASSIKQLISEIFGQESNNILINNVVPNEKEKENNLYESYNALIISVEDYTIDDLDLEYPEEDAQKLYNVLTANYSFPAGNVQHLKNPTRKEIISALSNLRRELDGNDNLLLFYAGHGDWDEDTEQGYWLPSDAEPGDQFNWVSNSDVRMYIKAIKNKHTLLISDACFSGGIFKTREAFMDDNLEIEQNSKLAGRRAITSGYIKEVPDKSVFMEYLVKALNNNSEKYLSSQKLYLLIRDAVTNNSPLRQTPLYGIIWDAGDEGGDFIFQHK